jgi:cbb3-type cytochrome oxidase subunit 3
MLALAGILLVLASGQAGSAPVPPAAALAPGAATGAPSATQPNGAATEDDAAPSPVSVVATPSTTEVSVGELFTIELKATGPAGTTYTFAGEASAEQLELRTPAPAKDAPAPEPGTHRYEAQVFALGELQLPGIPVRYKLTDGAEGQATSGPIALKVVSLLPKEEAEQKLADIRGPASVGIGRAFWVALAVFVIVLGALAYYLLRRRRKTESPAAARAPEVAPDVEALAAIDALARDALPTRGELRLFYIRLSTILKRYLERRLGAPVLEMTSAETLAFLRAHAHGSELLPVVREVAEAADRVKFAKGHGVVAEAERHLASVRALVPALEARLAPRPAEPEGRAA